MIKLQLSDRLAEIPYRFGSPTHAGSATWPLSKQDLARISITWPTVYQHPPAAFFYATLKDAFHRLRVLRLERTEQVHKGIVLLACAVDGRRHVVALDGSDNKDFINHAALDPCSLYIKMMFREEGYDDPRIIRGGYPVTGRVYYRYYMPYRRLGNANPSIDVMARFGYEFQRDFRLRAVNLLSSAPEILCVGKTGKVRYSRFLREAASARLSLNLPGNGPFTHRVVEFLGLGTCMMSLRLTTSLHVPIIPGTHYVVIADDLSDLLMKTRYYLAHEDERTKIALAGAEHFDRYLHSEQLVQYLIRKILDHLGRNDA